MSIFKQTFKEHLQKQITARQNLLSSSDSRSISFQQYVASKSPWVKMTSLVDYKNDTKLARQHILCGGTLYPNPEREDEYSLRSGVSIKGASYGSTLGNNSQYGIRPMPGITSVSIKSRGAYGSLRDATIKYYAWDLKQLENLSILFMKPGYPVVLEWGWSMYINNDDNRTSDYKLITPDFLTVDCFDPLLSQENLYDQFERNNIRYKGNYEGMLGLIKNFEYFILPNGGFECTTTLVSIGDVIESLRMNTVTGTSLGDTQVPVIPSQGNIQNTTSNTENQADIKSDFELLMDWVSNSEDIRNTPGPYFNGVRPPQDPNIDTKILDFGEENYILSYLPKNDDRNKKYIQFAYFLYLLNQKHNLFIPNNKTLVKYEIPLPNIASNKGNGLCVSSYNAMSIDSSVCIIKNSNAKLLGTDGFAPYKRDALSRQNVKLEMPEYLYADSNLGIIGNIYINLGKIVDVYKSISFENNGKVTIAKFLRALLSKIEFSLGSINSFDIYVENNVGVIIDKHYVENPSDSDPNSKFELNILGNNSTARNHRVVSKIFQEQSTIIAIAAQDRANIASYQSSTNVYMNKDIYNRLYKNSSESSTQDVAVESSERDKDKNTYLKNTTTLLSYVKEYVLQGKRPESYGMTLESLNTILNNLLVKLEGGTDYKGIVPLALEVTLDGIGGVGIGEIFKINTDILPTQYADKSVGFIVTGIEQDITRADWTTRITAQFCLLDQLKKQQIVREQSQQFFNQVVKYSDVEKQKIESSIYSYNILLAFIADFFKDSYDVLLYDTEFEANQGNTQPQLSPDVNISENIIVRQGRSAVENPSSPGSLIGVTNIKVYKSNVIQAFLKYNNESKKPYYLRAVLNQFGGNEGEAFSQFGTLLLLGKNQKQYRTRPDYLIKMLLSRYLNGYAQRITRSGVRVDELSTELDANKSGAIDNYIKALVFLVKQSTYYTKIENPQIKQIFNESLDSIIDAYKNEKSIFVKYLNKNAYNDYGLLDNRLLYLTEGVNIDYGDNLLEYNYYGNLIKPTYANIDLKNNKAPIFYK